MRDFCLDTQFDIIFYDQEIETIQGNYRRKRLREALIGPIVSTLVHIAILVCLFLFGTDNPMNEVRDITVNLIIQPEIKIEPLPVESPVPDKVLAINDLRPDLKPNVNENFNELDLSFLENVSDEEPATDDNVVNDDSVSDVKLSQSVIIDNISGAMEDRESSESAPFSRISLNTQRAKLNRIEQTVRNGGTLLGQQVLEKSLWWLASVQNPDGSWGKQDTRAMTGLAVLTFLAHGDTHLSRHFGGNMKKAFKWLIYDKIDSRHEKGYGHAIKTYALCEAYSMTLLNDLEKPMTECVSKILSGQQKCGAFDYYLNPDSNRQDMSVTGWCMQALKAAYVTGMENKELPKSIYKGLDWLVERSADKGSFPYCVENGQAKGGNKHTMRAIGALCLQLYGKAKQDSLKDELKTISSKDVELIDWFKPPPRSLYAWYYSTQSVFQQGGAAFRNWNGRMERMLIQNQHPKGYWQYPGKNHGAEKMDDLTGKIYATTLSSLILTVYYRYLPTYKGLFLEQKKGAKAVQEELVNVVE